MFGFQVIEQAVMFLLRSLFLNQLTNLIANGHHCLCQFLIRRTNFVTEELDNTQKSAATANRKSESAMQTYTLCDVKAWKVVILLNISKPDWLSCEPHTSWQSNSPRKEYLFA